MVAILVQLLVVIIVFGLIWYILSVLPLPDPFGRIAQVIVIVVFCLVLIVMLLNLAGLGGSLGLGKL